MIDPYETPANVEEYPDARKIARSLSERQIRLLHALSDVDGQPSLLREIAVHPDDVPSAMGLHRRGLVGTRRPESWSGFKRRPVPGTKRWIWFLPKGRAVVQHLPPPPPEQLVHVRFKGESVTIEVDGLTATTGRLLDGILIVQDAEAIEPEAWEKVADAVRRRSR